MSKINGSSLMFNEDDIRSTDRHLPRLIRIIFYRLGITNDSYIEHYKRYYQRVWPDRSQKEFTQKAAADRKFLNEPKKLTINMLSSVMLAMGWDIEAVEIRTRNRLTGETKTFTTDSTVEELDAEIEQDNQVGVGSL